MLFRSLAKHGDSLQRFTLKAKLSTVKGATLTSMTVSVGHAVLVGMNQSPTYLTQNIKGIKVNVTKATTSKFSCIVLGLAEITDGLLRVLSFGYYRSSLVLDTAAYLAKRNFRKFIG